MRPMSRMPAFRGDPDRCVIVGTVRSNDQRIKVPVGAEEPSEESSPAGPMAFVRLTPAGRSVGRVAKRDVKPFDRRWSAQKVPPPFAPGDLSCAILSLPPHLVIRPAVAPTSRPRMRLDDLEHVGPADAALHQEALRTAPTRRVHRFVREVRALRDHGDGGDRRRGADRTQALQPGRLRHHHVEDHQPRQRLRKPFQQIGARSE